MAQKNMTIETLAEMINEGFKTTASKEDIKEVTTRLDGIDSRLDTLDARLGRIEADVHALRDEMVHRREFEDVLDRVKYIEKKLGIESGV
jgi:tetrahydromethanopterin S-methyltransferase subunit G